MRAVVTFRRTDLVVADLLWLYCARVSDGAAVATDGATLTPLGAGAYLLDVVAATEATAFGVQVAADDTDWDNGVVSPPPLAAAAYTAPDNAGLAAVKAKTDALPADPASATQVETRLAAAAYTAPDNAGLAAGLAAVQAKTDALPADPASATQVETRLAAAAYTALDTAGLAAALAAVKAKTDALPADPASATQVETRLAADAYVAPENDALAALIRAARCRAPATGGTTSTAAPASRATTRTVYNGGDNRLVVCVNANGAAADLSGVARLTLSEGATVLVDSATAGAGVGQAFDWSQGTGVLVLYLGHEQLQAGARYLTLTLYDAEAPNGVRVAGTLPLFVVAGTPGTRYPGKTLDPPVPLGPSLDTAAQYTASFATLAAGYTLTSSGQILDETGAPITDETGDALTEG